MEFELLTSLTPIPARETLAQGVKFCVCNFLEILEINFLYFSTLYSAVDGRFGSYFFRKYLDFLDFARSIVNTCNSRVGNQDPLLHVGENHGVRLHCENCPPIAKICHFGRNSGAHGNSIFFKPESEKMLRLSKRLICRLEMSQFWSQVEVCRVVKLATTQLICIFAAGDLTPTPNTLMSS